MNDSQLFVSHSNADTLFVQKLKTDLQQHFSVWIDDDIDCLSPGDSLVERLDAALNDMSHFLIVCTPESMSSAWVRKELESARSRLSERGIAKIVPVIYKPCVLPESLGEFVYVDFSDIVFFAEANELLCAGPDERSKYGERLAAIVNAIRATAPEQLRHVSPPVSGDDSTQFLLRLVGYQTNAAISRRARAIARVREEVDEGLARPLSLPLQFRQCGFEVGDRFVCEYGGRSEAVHLSGYTRDNMRLALQKSLRDALGLRNFHVYKVKVALGKRKIAFYDSRHSKAKE